MMWGTSLEASASFAAIALACALEHLVEQRFDPEWMWRPQHGGGEDRPDRLRDELHRVRG
jgi:hypothetical protein